MKIKKNRKIKKGLTIWLKSIELGLIDSENNAVCLNIPIKSIYMLNIDGITSSIGYASNGDKEFSKQLSFKKLDLKLNSTNNKDIILGNPFIISMIVYLDNNTKIFYDVPYKPSNDESRRNALQEVKEEKFNDNDIVRILINDK